MPVCSVFRFIVNQGMPLGPPFEAKKFIQSNKLKQKSFYQILEIFKRKKFVVIFPVYTIVL